MMTFTLEIIVFLSGACVMILEIIGARILAPYMGTSIQVWTSLIGIILASLSAGYWIGGRLSDTFNPHKLLVMVLLLSSFFVGLIALVKQPILFFIYEQIDDLRISSAIAALSLFSLPGFLLGMVLPISIKMRLKDLQNTGKTVGRLYAYSTLGSISGTFLTGYFLIAFLGHTMIITLISFTLLFCAFLSGLNLKLKPLQLLTFIGFFSWLIMTYQVLATPVSMIDVDSQYNRIWIYQTKDWKSNQPVLRMRINDEASAEIFVKSKEIVWDYIKFFRAAKHFSPSMKQALLIGGGAYSFPKDFSKLYPDVSLDIVEIDNKLLELSKQYFDYTPHQNHHIFHQDGRQFLNKSSKMYDVIFLDAMRSTVPPFQLTTLEFMQNVQKHLHSEGFMMMNIIGAFSGLKSKLLRAYVSTCKAVFPRVELFSVYGNYPDNQQQNIVLMAFNSNKSISFFSHNKEENDYLKQRFRKKLTSGPVLLDDFAPVEEYGKFISNQWQKNSIIRLLRTKN